MKLTGKIKVLVLVFAMITLLGFYLQYQESYVQYILTTIYFLAGLLLLIIHKMKDGMFKLYMVINLWLMAGSSYIYSIKDDWHGWFGTFIAVSIVSYFPLLMAGLRRNVHLHALSLLRQHPWISAVFMAIGYFAYKEIGVLKGPRELPVILLLAMAVATLLFLIERSQKVTQSSFYTMLIGALTVFTFHFFILKSTIGRMEDWIPFVNIFLAGTSSCLLIMGTLFYEATEK